MNILFQIVDYYSKMIIANLLKIFFILPLKKKTLMFSSFFGKQYSCNPKYISEYMQRYYPKYTIVWAFITPKEFIFLKESNISLVRLNSLKYIYYRLTCAVYVTNCGEMATIPTRDKQLHINTWHGGGCYKLSGVKNHQTFERKYYMKKQMRSMNNPNLYISPCHYDSVEVYQKSFLYNGKIAETGYPRNDIMFEDSSALTMKVKKYFSIEPNDKICLYAPTFRQYGVVFDAEIDLSRMKGNLERRFGGKWKILYRNHQSCDSKEIVHHVISATAYPDMQELLVASDVLVTDYSSSMWDFSLTFKPCFLYVPDLESYNSDRSFYEPFDSWGFPHAKNNDEFESLILNFDEESFRSNMYNHHCKLKSFDDGKARQRVGQIILEHIANL